LFSSKCGSEGDSDQRFKISDMPNNETMRS
jgi:hypothetical protein